MSPKIGNDADTSITLDAVAKSTGLNGLRRSLKTFTETIQAALKGCVDVKTFTYV